MIRFDGCCISFIQSVTCSLKLFWFVVGNEYGSHFTTRTCTCTCTNTLINIAITFFVWEYILNMVIVFSRTVTYTLQYILCLQKRKATLGDVHPHTLSSINNVAGLYYYQEKYNAAEPFFVECLEKQKSTLGADHPRTLNSIGNLALLYFKQGKYNAVLPLIVECLEKNKATLGPDHPDTLMSIAWLSRVREKLK